MFKRRRKERKSKKEKNLVFNIVNESHWKRKEIYKLLPGVINPDTADDNKVSYVFFPFACSIYCQILVLQD